MDRSHLIVLWRKLVYDGKLSFLKQWWKLWFEKYHARRQKNVIIEARKSKSSFEFVTSRQIIPKWSKQPIDKQNLHTYYCFLSSPLHT